MFICAHCKQPSIAEREIGRAARCSLNVDNGTTMTCDHCGKDTTVLLCTGEDYVTACKALHDKAGNGL